MEQIDLFQAIGSNRDAWSVGHMNNIDLVIHGGDYFHKLIATCPTFKGYGPEYLELAKAVLEEICSLEEKRIRPTFMFLKWLQSAKVDTYEETRREKVVRFSHMVQHLYDQSLLENLWDPVISNTPNLSRVFLETLQLLPGVRLLSCDTHLNRTLVSYAAAKKFHFMASSVQCGLFQAQMEKPTTFWDTMLFGKRKGVEQSVCYDFKPSKFHQICTDRQCLPILAYLTTDVGSQHYSTIKAHLENPDSQNEAAIKEWYAVVGQWLDKRGYTESLSTILSLYVDGEFVDKGKKLFSDIANFTLQKFQSETNQLSLTVLNRSDDATTTPVINPPSTSNDAKVKELDYYDYDWYMTLSTAYFQEDAAAFSQQVEGRQASFVSAVLAGISASKTCSTATVNHLQDLQVKVLGDIERKKKRNFKYYAGNIFNIETSDLSSAPVAHLLAIFLKSWLNLTDSPQESSLVTCHAVAAVALVTVTFLNKSDKKVLLQHLSKLNNLNDLIYYKCMKVDSSNSLTPSNFAKIMTELEQFLIEFRRLLGLVDVSCLLAQRRPGTSKMNWPSKEFVSQWPLWMIFPSNRLVFALVRLLERYTPEGWISYLTDVWIPLFLSESSELENVKLQLVWIHDYLTKTPSGKEQLVQPD